MNESLPKYCVHEPEIHHQTHFSQFRNENA